VDTTRTLAVAPDEAPTVARSDDPGTPAAATAGPLVLDRYRLVRRLGTGGFGAVWLARDERLDRHVAVKAIPRAGARAERESVAAARLNHPGIVALYEAGGDEHGHYLVSELVEGPTLAQLMSAGALSDRDVVRIGVALADALEHAHRRAVVHRDVKPQNVIVPICPESPAGVAKLTDFGIALLVGDEPLTRTGDVVGTLAYMAPEQAEGRRVGPGADVYALALVLYEALSGAHPVRGAGPADTARRLGATLPSLGRLRRDLPAGLVAAIDRALRPAPEERGELRELRAALDEAQPEVSDEGGTLPALPRGRVRAPRGAGRLAAGAAAGGLAVGATTLAPGDVPAGLVAAATAAAVMLLPRVGWLAAAIAAIAWLAAPPAREPGTAVVVAAGLLACPLLVPRAGRAWSLPALAPLLGVVGLAAAFCAVAGQARTWPRRAALGALGLWWTVLAEALAGRELYLGPPRDVTAPGDWADSAREAAVHVVAPLATSGVLVAGLAWAAAAVALPWLVRGASRLADATGAALWAVGLAAGIAAAAAFATPALADAHPRGGLAGAAVGAALAVGLRALRGPDPPRLRLPATPGAAADGPAF
jgi:eukaryotic-like serine/threonine-protein kinase